jgi:hypothetical protein
MLNVTEIQIQAFVEHLQQGYRRTFGGLEPEYPEIIAWAGGMALENIANSDALYHNVEHTILVTLVGQEMLRGKQIREGRVTPRDWLHFVISLVCHDIGYVNGVCRDDRDGVCATGRAGETITLPPGATDASLTPYHVDRGKLFVRERFGGHPLIDVEAVQSYIEPTRFPVPAGDEAKDGAGFAGLVRAADLIGQLGDPRYLKKIPALFQEFAETGVNQRLGYGHPGELRQNYPRFYWSCVSPYIQDGLRYLASTQQGQQMRANLFANVFVVEHEREASFGGPPKSKV